MKKTKIVLLVLPVLLVTGSSFFMQGSLQGTQTPEFEDNVAVSGSRSGINVNYGRLPLYFIKNNGQAHTDALFYARTRGYSIRLTRQGMEFSQKQQHRAKNMLEQDVFSLEFLGANSDPEIIPVNQSEYRVNYFIGSDSSEWRTNVPTTHAVLYKGLYPAIDLKVYGREDQVEYDWIVRSGGNVADIRLAFKNTVAARLDAEGNLTLTTQLGEYRHLKPVCFQDINGTRIPVAGSFQELSPNLFGFSVSAYDKDHALVIDPVILVYSTYLGTKDYDDVQAIAVDPSGAAYITGLAGGSYFSLSDTNEDKFLPSDPEIYVTKINPAGSKLVYTAYLGGSGNTMCHDLAVDKKGSVYVIGYTRAADFPLKKPFQPKHKGSDDIYIFKLNPDGSTLAYSSFFGGTSQDWGTSIAVDKKGAAYITGMTVSSDIPLKKAFQKTYQGSKQGYPWDSFVAKIHPKGIRLVYSSYLGGNGQDSGYGIAVNSKGEAYVTGGTSSTNFPRKKAAQKTFAGLADAFVTKIHRKGNRLLYSTFLGGESWDSGNSIAVDSKGAAYVAGDTGSNDFPVKNAAKEDLLNDYDESENDAFVTKLSPAGSKIVYSTFLGGGNYESATDITVDALGAAYVTGVTASKNFPLKDPFQKSKKGDGDAFVSKLHPNGQSLLFSTFLGGSRYEYSNGIALGNAGSIYVTGVTDSKDFPVKKAIKKKKSGKKDAMDIFVTKMELK